jgi:hypothetical protein
MYFCFVIMPHKIHLFHQIAKVLRVKNFKPPQLSPSVDKEKFATIWLALLCKDNDMTKGMLLQLTIENYPITKVQAQQYLNSQEACKPYRTILKD